jgi:hypothetical protein
LLRGSRPAPTSGGTLRDRARAEAEGARGRRGEGEEHELAAVHARDVLDLLGDLLGFGL